MEYEHLIYEKQGKVARITLNRPEKLNVLTFVGREKDMQEVNYALDDAAEDDNITVVVIRGNGRSFCAGEDLNRVGFVYGMSSGKDGDNRRASQRTRLRIDNYLVEDLRRLLYHPKITIAGVQGHALAGGAHLATLCDFTIAANNARFGYPAERLGFAGQGTTLPHLVASVGLKRALDLKITGRLISGKTAAEWGLVTKSVPLKQLDEEVEKWVEAMKLLPKDGIAMGKEVRRQLYSVMGMDTWFSIYAMSHTLFTNIRWEPDEYNFFKGRRDESSKAAFHAMNARFDGLFPEPDDGDDAE